MIQNLKNKCTRYLRVGQKQFTQQFGYLIYKNKVLNSRNVWDVSNENEILQTNYKFFQSSFILDYCNDLHWSNTFSRNAGIIKPF